LASALIVFYSQAVLSGLQLRLNFVTVKRIIILVCLSAGVWNSGCSQTEPDQERLRIAREFVMEIKYGMSSAELIHKYVRSIHYDDVDSIRKAVDLYLAQMNKQLQRIPDHDLVADLYVTHQDKYARKFQRIEESDLKGGEKKPMQISLVTSEGAKKQVNLKDVYMVHEVNKFNEGEIFIIFDDENKIVSFIGWHVGIFQAMMQF
jgi:hypothetical protein